MKSIQTKILVLIIPALLICTSLVGGVGVISAQRIIDRNTDEYLTVLCSEQSEIIESLFDRVEQSVDIMAVNALEELESAEALQQESYREAYTEKMRQMLVTTTEHTVGSVAVYLRYNPELAPPTSGIFMEKNRFGENLRKRRPTDLSQYSPDDLEHVGWYYTPVKAGKPVWMGPYRNENMRIKMISYVVPLIKDGEILGVIGMDIDFYYITNQISKIRVYDGGGAYLIDENDALVYHPALLTEEEISRQNQYTMVGDPLKNGMKLVITAPFSEINREKNDLVTSILIFAGVLLALFTVLSKLVTSSIVQPVKKLNQATHQIAEGNLDVQIDVHTKDEIGELAESFRKTVEHMQYYVDYINGLAYKDALTGGKNKTAYDNAEKKIQERMDKGEYFSFGVVVLDINELKPVNDAFGHDFGNMLIINSYRLIRDTFAHSPVFRIGGDEFTVILTGEDLENREKLLQQLRLRMKNTWSSANPTARISIAVGIAVFDPGRDACVGDVFKRADAEMYQNKRLMKGESEDRIQS